jgi:methylated-DNA-[protein]-cysteine S-methyltransferase
MAREKTEPLYCWEMSLEEVTVYLTSSKQGACAVGIRLRKAGDRPGYFRQMFPGRKIVKDLEMNRPLLKAVTAAWENRPVPKNLSLDVQGTPFQKSVWEAVAKIPYGETRTYGQVARMVGIPKGARAIGQAMGRNPLLLLFP